MPIEIKELVIKGTLTEHNGAIVGDATIQNLKKEILKECKKEIRKEIAKLKHR